MNLDEKIISEIEKKLPANWKRLNRSVHKKLLIK